MNKQTHMILRNKRILPATRLAALLLIVFLTGATDSLLANQAKIDGPAVATTVVSTNDTLGNGTSGNLKKITNPAVIPVVTYNQVQDQLTVKVKSIPLYQVLTSIARQSGLQIVMDSTIDLNVSANFENQSLLKGLQQLLRKTNSAYFFDSKKSENKQLLLAVKILPQGKLSSTNLRPLVGLPQEAIQHTRNQNITKTRGSKNSSYAAQRWQARLERMPADKRTRLEEMAKKKLDEEAKRKEKLAKYKEKRKAVRMEKRQKHKARIAAMEKNLKENHPDQYAEYQRARAEGRQRALQGQDERGILTFGR